MFLVLKKFHDRAKSLLIKFKTGKLENGYD